MNLNPMNLPSATPARTRQQQICRNSLMYLQPEAIYYAAMLADYGWDEIAEKLEATEAFLIYHRKNVSEKRLCKIFSMIIAHRKKGENK